MRLDGKIAIVTGGGSGIGRATSLRLASEGAKVAIADIDARGGGETVALIGQEEFAHPAFYVHCDVTDIVSVHAAVGAVQREWGGRVDVLVNNAGWDRVEPFLQSTPETWEKVIAINLVGTIGFTHAVLPVMVEQGAGHVISISSDAGRVGSTGEAVYSACKAGIIGFSKTVAREMARHNITVNVICPGPTRTPLLDALTRGERGAKIIEGMTRAMPFRRLGEPEEVAAAVAFFASEDAAFCTGQVLSVSGGLTMAG